MTSYKLTRARVPHVATAIVRLTELQGSRAYWDRRRSCLHLAFNEMDLPLVGWYDYRATPAQVAEDLFAVLGV